MITPVISVSAKSYPRSSNAKTVDGDDSYIIENVPYVSMHTDGDCELAAFTMLVRYLNKNFSYNDVFYFVGVGYALASRSRIISWNFPSIPLKPSLIMGSVICYWKQDWEFIAGLVGAECNITYSYKRKIVNVINHEEAWNEYWGRVKTYIKQDLPVYTQVDMSRLTYYQENNYFPEDSPAICHAIVLVGFNETNGTFCYHDGEPGHAGQPENGTYVYDEIDVLRRAVERAPESGYIIYKNAYCTMVLENKSNALPKKEAYEQAHNRSLKKMQGRNRDAYDEVFLRCYHRFGIEAIKALKQDLRPINILLKIPLMLFLENVFPYFSSFHWIGTATKFIVCEKQIASDVLLEQDDLCSFCQREGKLLQNETQKWKEFRSRYIDLKNILKNETLVKIMIFSIPILQNMQSTLDDIISIEEAILNNHNLRYYMEG